MNKKELKKWKKLREKGKLNYLLKYGILFYGMPVGTVIVFMTNISSEGLQNTLTLKGIVGCTITGILYGILVGLAYGFLSWKLKERKWKNRHISND